MSISYEPVRDLRNGFAFRTPVAEIELLIVALIGSMFICRTRTWLVPWLLMALISMISGPIIAYSGPTDSLEAVMPLANMRYVLQPVFGIICTMISLTAIRWFDRL